MLKIFRHFASSKETKIQLSIAELNYVKRNFKLLSESDCSRNLKLTVRYKGNFSTYFQETKDLIHEREQKLIKALEKVEKNNQLMKQRRMKFQIPTVAVIGYTNCGKTSLIKALTHDSILVPQDRLFATLSVSHHLTRLPSNVEVLLIDTIGFITEIPTALIHSFKTTLTEIKTADAIVHVIDCSHPRWQTQRDIVISTLEEIDVPSKLLDSIIEVSNKVDKLDRKILDQLMENKNKINQLLVSATERIGLDELKEVIEKEVMVNTERMKFKIRYLIYHNKI